MLPAGEAIFSAKKTKALPHPFVLDALEAALPETRPMFGCTAVYVGEKIVMILRDKAGADPDNGVWIATIPEHHDSLRRELPSLRSITVFGSGVTGWQVLPVTGPEFEEEALRACEMVLVGDPRIGKIPGEKRKTTPRVKPAAETKPAAKTPTKPAAKTTTTKPAAKTTKPAAKTAKPAAKTTKPAAKKQRASR
jgi:cell division septation protein DedD